MPRKLISVYMIVTIRTYKPKPSGKQKLANPYLGKFKMAASMLLTWARPS